MKTIRFTIFSILFGLVVLVSACKKEATPVAVTQSGSKILVTGQDTGTGLKSTLSGQSTVWIATSDKVGVYSSQARAATGGSGSAIVNAEFTAAASGPSSAFTGTMFWGTGTATDHTFYAYYPYTAGSAASTAVPVSLATAQTQSAAGSSAHIGSLDFMVATPVTVVSPGNTDAVGSAVNLSYNHLFTVLEFQIKGTGLLKAVSLSTSNTLAFSGGTINIGQSTPATDVAYTFASQTGTTNQATVTLTSPATLNASTATTVYMVINPGTQTGNCLIGLSSDGTNWTYISKTAPTGGFLRGKKYVVTIDQATASASAAGFSYQGGKIFYILQPSDFGYVSGETHGLIAATSDQSIAIRWAEPAYQSTSVAGTLTTLGSGSANTDKIIAQNGAVSTYAAGLARAYRGGGYSDWYLPSQDELNLLYLQKNAFGGFASASYWSSSENYWSAAFNQYFPNNGQYSNDKSYALRVRAVRAF